MDRKTYKKFTLKEMKGKRVRTLETMHNGRVAIPKGSIMVIQDKMNGFTLWSEACVTCGVEVRISRVEPYKVEFLGAWEVPQVLAAPAVLS